MSRRLVLLSLASVLLSSLAGSASADRRPLDMPVEARFEGDVSVLQIYEILGGLSGLRFVFDEGVRLDEKTSPNLHGLPMDEALGLLDLTLGVFRKEVSPGVQLVAPDNQTKRREYEEQAVRTFYLRHADVKTVNALLRGIIDIRKTAVDEATRSLTLRDTESKIALAAELISHLDIERPRFGLSVELWLLEPRSSRELGKQLDASGVLPTRAVDRVRSRSGVELLLRQDLSAVDGKALQFALADPSRLTFELQASADLHLDSRQLTLAVAAELGLPAAADADAGKARRRLEASARLGEGQTLVLPGLLRLDPDTLLARDLLDRSVAASQGVELAVLLTPRVESWPTIPETARSTLRIGTERRISFPRD